MTSVPLPRPTTSPWAARRGVARARPAPAPGARRGPSPPARAPPSSGPGREEEHRVVPEAPGSARCAEDAPAALPPREPHLSSPGEASASTQRNAPPRSGPGLAPSLRGAPGPGPRRFRPRSAPSALPGLPERVDEQARVVRHRPERRRPGRRQRLEPGVALQRVLALLHLRHRRDVVQREDVEPLDPRLQLAQLPGIPGGEEEPSSSQCVASAPRSAERRPPARRRPGRPAHAARTTPSPRCPAPPPACPRRWPRRSCPPRRRCPPRSRGRSPPRL